MAWEPTTLITVCPMCDELGESTCQCGACHWQWEEINEEEE